MKTNSNREGVKVLAAGSILQLFLGIIYVWSVFVTPVSESLNWAIADAKLTASFMLCFFVIGILTGGKIQLKLGAQKVVLAGGLALALGTLASSFVPSSVAWLIYVTYGIVGGFGVGMAYNTIISCAQKWFPANRGLATGISVFAFGFSTVIFAPLVKSLIENFDVTSTFRILAAAFGVMTLVLFSFIKFPSESNAAGSASFGDEAQFTTSEMLKTPQFYLVAFSMMLFTASFFILNPSFVTFAAERGISDNITILLVQITGVASAAGRLITPIMADLIGREKATFTIAAATAVFTALLSFATGGLLIASIAVIAFCYGSSSGVYPLVTSQYFGLKHIGSNYGMVMVGFMLSALLFPLFIGKIDDAMLRFITLATMSALSAVLIVLLSVSKKSMKQHKNHQI